MARVRRNIRCNNFRPNRLPRQASLIFWLSFRRIRLMHITLGFHCSPRALILSINELNTPLRSTELWSPSSPSKWRSLKCNIKTNTIRLRVCILSLRPFGWPRGSMRTRHPTSTSTLLRFAAFYCIIWVL